MPSDSAVQIPRKSIHVSKIDGLETVVTRIAITTVVTHVATAVTTIHLTDIVDVPTPSASGFFYVDGTGAYQWMPLTDLLQLIHDDQSVIGAVTITKPMARITAVALAGNYALTMPLTSGWPARVEIIVKDETGLLSSGVGATTVTLTANVSETFEGAAGTIVMNTPFQVLRLYHAGTGIWYRI